MVHVHIHYPEPLVEGSPAYIAPEDQAHFIETFNRALRLSSSSNVASADIYLGVRTVDRTIGDYVQPGGWLEHTIRISYKAQREGDTMQGLTVGAIQREPGRASEFHS